MYKSIICNQRFNQGYSYVRRQRVKISGGKTKMSDLKIYENIPLTFVPDKLRAGWSGDGRQVRSFAKAVIPNKFFTNNEFVPIIDDMMIGKNDVRYKIVEIEDYIDHPHTGIYYIILKRIETPNAF